METLRYSDHCNIQSAQGGEREQCAYLQEQQIASVQAYEGMQKHYAKGSPDRKALEAALHEIGQKPLEVPTIIDGKEVSHFQTFMI